MGRYSEEAELRQKTGNKGQRAGVTWRMGKSRRVGWTLEQKVWREQKNRGLEKIVAPLAPLKPVQAEKLKGKQGFPMFPGSVIP